MRRCSVESAGTELMKHELDIGTRNIVTDRQQQLDVGICTFSFHIEGALLTLSDPQNSTRPWSSSSDNSRPSVTTANASHPSCSNTSPVMANPNCHRCSSGTALDVGASSFLVDLPQWAPVIPNGEFDVRCVHQFGCARYSIVIMGRSSLLGSSLVADFVHVLGVCGCSSCALFQGRQERPSAR